jgi:PBP1b-binding outer membrane lipoprotein LpoB
MMKKMIRISFVIALAVLMVSCKNTKQKLQEYVTSYNSTAASFKADDITLTTARGYINDNKIELRFETNLEQNASNAGKANASFPKLLKEMIAKNQIPKELVEEGVQFDAYFLANDNTVFVKEIINKESISELLK